MSDSGDADASEETVQLCQNSSVNDDEANNNAKESFEANLVIKRKRSVVWEYFSFKGSEQKGPNKERVFCKICEKTVKKGKMMMGILYCGGTTNMTNHLKVWHKSEFKKTLEEENEKSKSKNITDFFGEKAKYVTHKSSANWKNVTMTIAKWFCKSSRPAQMEEDKGFRVLMDMVCPQ